MGIEKVSGIKQLGPTAISVRDIERSARFYAALGFELGDRVPVPNSGAIAIGAKGAQAALIMQRIIRDGAIFLLLEVKPPPADEPGRGAALQFGLAHLELMVEDVDGVAAGIARHGGAILKQTRCILTDAGPSTLHTVFCKDPDGTLIVLVQQSA